MNREEVLQTFHQFLDIKEDHLKAKAEKLSTFATFLARGPGIIQKFSSHFLTQKDDTEADRTSKKQVIFWLFRRLLFIKSHLIERNLEISGLCDPMLSEMLSLLALREPFTFRLVIQHVLVLLQDLNEASQILFGDVGEAKHVTTVPPFASSEPDANIEDSKFTFFSPFIVEHLEADMVYLLIEQEQPLVYWTFDLALNGLWPLLTCFINLGEVSLKKASMKLLSLIMRKGCVSKSPKLMLHLVNMVFAMVKHEIEGGSRCVLSEQLCMVLDSIFEASKSDTILSQICDREVVDLLSEVDFSLLKRHDGLLKSVTPFLVKVCPDVHTDCMVNEVIAAKINQELKDSGVWRCEKFKLSLIEDNQVCAQRLETVLIQQECQSWRDLMETVDLSNESVAIQKLSSLASIAMMVQAEVQAEFQVATVELDFFGKNIIQETIEFLINATIGNAKNFPEAITIVDKLLRCQGKETFTQSALNQAVALASLTCLSSEAKPLDLRMSETLLVNLIRISDGISLEDSCVRILVSVMKDIAPRWRMLVLRKLEVHQTIGHLDMLIFYMGKNGIPLAKELLLNAMGCTKATRILSKMAGRLLCALSQKTKIKHVVKDGEVFEDLDCKICSGSEKAPAEDVDIVKEILVKLIGHEDKQVQLNLIDCLIQPMANHGLMTSEVTSLWLHCLDSSDEDVAWKFSRFIHYLPDKEEDMIIERLKEAKSRDGDQYQEALCQCLKNLSRKRNLTESFQLSLLDLCMDFLMNERTHVTAFMIGDDIRSLINANMDFAMKKLAQRMCYTDAKTSVDSILVLYRGVSVPKFLMSQAPRILPHVVFQCSETDVRPALLYMASQLSTKVKILLVIWFQKIYPMIVTEVANTAHYQKCTTFLEEETKLTIKELVHSHRQKVITELLVHFHGHTKRITTAFKFLAKHDDEFKLQDQMTSKDMARYIQPRFLGVLGFFDQKLKSDATPLKLKTEILASLAELVKFMGSDKVASVKHKILSTLNTGYLVPGIDPQVILSNWEAFITTIDIISLKPILCQVIASLLQIYNRCERKTLIKLFYYLLISNKARLADSFDQLNFIPEDEDLKEITLIVQKKNGMLSETTEFRCFLKGLCNSLLNENSDVRTFTLIKLLKLLQLNQGKLQGLILSNDETAPIISLVILLLLQCTRNSDDKVAILAGACLGSIGAVDPGRLHWVEDLNQGTHEVYLTVLEEDFIVELLNKLVKAYLSNSDSTDADACSYSIQESLKAYKITGSGKLSTLNGRVWNKLSDSTKEVLQPLLVSLYTKTETNIKFGVPIYKSSNGLSYSDWISNWSSHLMSQISDQYIVSIFNACKPAVRKDSGVAQFLLPYILVYVLCNGSPESKQEIIMEVDAILGSDEDVGIQAATLNGSILAVKQKVAQDLDWMAKQTVFSVMDHMNKWMGKKYKDILAGLRRSKSADFEAEVNKHEDYVAVKNFIKAIKQHKLALASFECRAYARSLMHLEAHLRDKPVDLECCMTKLQQVYGALDEPDYVIGLAAIRKKKPTLDELIHHHQVTGNFQDALACYESLGKSRTDSIELKSGILRCYLEMDQPHTASMLVKGLVERDPDLQAELVKYQVESAWQLGQWEVVEESCRKTDSNDWSTLLGKALLQAQLNDLEGLQKLVGNMRKDLIIPISAAAMEQGAYRRCYEYQVKLQILDEIEAISRTPDEELANLFVEWKTRITFSQYSLSTLEPVLKVRRALLDIALARSGGNSDLLRHELGECWVLSAKVARKAGQLNKAYNLLLEAEKANHPEIFIERAKLYWARDAKTEAIGTLEKGIVDQFPTLAFGFAKSAVSQAGKDDLEVCGKAKLLLARYVDEAANLGPEVVPTYYNEAKALAPASEDAFYYSARFFDKVIGKSYEETDLDVRGDIISHIIMQYARSLIYGCNHLHQSLARLLSLWLDYGSRVAAKNNGQSKSVVSEMTKCLSKMNEIIQKFSEKAPSFYFLSVFPQLTSRICHAHPEVWAILRGILIRTFIAFPQHVFWHMVALSKSSYAQRASRCKEIFDHVRSKLENGKFIDDGLSLADKLVKLSDEKLDVGEMDIKEVMPSLCKMLSNKNFSSIMLPSTSNMTVMLPTASMLHTAEPFQGDLVHIHGIEDTIVVMKSLVQPKKVTFRGSDGGLHSFLCKPKDDLRRDCRLLDFNNLLNKLFMKDPESRKRNLHIRTYTVIPLNEANGIIEWVNNLQPLRAIITKLLKEILGKNAMRQDELKAFITSPTDVEGNKAKYFRLIKKNPPVFAEWFVRNFPDPQAWFMARLAYTRTTAVMSMVGYLLGLGDRHGENILFDSSNGDTVHVDLNCLFDKGKDLKIPEVVPFRLTHNMVQAMGPTGVEGPFRIACEVALGLMRKQKDVLMSALRPFYFDPLLDWVPDGKHKKTDTGEVVNKKAVETLKSIENKLNGLVESKKKTASINMPLSVAGQVQHLIKEATCDELLSQMYLGWGSYL